VSAPVVSLWRTRYQRDGLAGLDSELRPGRPRKHTDDNVAGLLQTVLQSKPEVASHWTIRSAAAKTGISKSSVGRYFALFGVQPHRSKSFKLSTDPFFVEKVRDIVGLYLNPPDKALVLCVDEKSQIQALERTQPILPMGLGYAEGVTHDYFRDGTTTLFAALDIVTGNVISQCKPRHRHQEFLSFLKHLDDNTPPALDLHLIADNYATHKHPQVKAWLAHHSRFQLHFTPTYSSWLNQVERWFGLITRQAIRRSSFRNIRQLVEKIEQYVDHKHKRPFVWTATAESILAQVERICKLINGTRH
jgi:putative transposase